MTQGETTTHEFQAEVSEVLRLVIHSLYSNPEIFLRELLSNASDAIDKRRFAAIADASLAAEGEPGIRIAFDEDAKTVTISDDGIGMSEAELRENLGTVAHSGSKAFLEQLAEAKKGDVSLIGQFGVGFYSAYLVADSVEVITRAAGSGEAHRWQSSGEKEYAIGAAERESVGTDIVLHLKEDAHEFANEWRLRELVRRYSDYVQHPIALRVSREVPPAEDAEEGAEPTREWSYERVNSSNALWRRDPSEVEVEQYEELYKHLTHDFEKPAAHRHFKVEGTQEFAGLLYLPKRPPFDLFAPESTHGVRLHVKRVFIMDDCEELLPKWLRFVRGIVDSEDLPLNVSREILQDSRVVKTIRKQVVKRSLDMIEELAKGDDYASFWEHFGAVLKEGLHGGEGGKEAERIAKLCRFRSTHDAEGEDAWTSLADYVGRMPEGQESIYFVQGASLALVKNAPHLEALKKRGFEVLLMTDPIDAFAIEGLREFDGKKLVNAMDGDLDLGEDQDEKKDDAQAAEGVEALRAKAAEVLAESISEVRLTSRLTDSPACLVMPTGGLPPYLDRVLRAQQGLPAPKRVLELNPDHPLVLAVAKRVEADAESADEWIGLIHDQAVLAEGSPLDDPSRLARKLTELLTDAAARD